MSQDVLLRRGSTAIISATAMTAVTLVLTGLSGTSAVGTATPVVVSDTVRPSGLSGTSAVGTATATAVVPMASLTDDFASGSLDTGRWSVVTATGSDVLQANGALQVTPGTASDAVAGVTSVGVYDLTGDAVTAYLFRLVDGSTSYVALRDGTGAGLVAQVWGGLGYVWLGVAQVTPGDLPTAYYTGTELASVSLATLGATQSLGCWVRWREASGTVYCETAPSTADNPPAANQWVERWSGTVTGVSLSALTVSLLASTELDAEVGYFDAVNAAVAYTEPTQAFDIKLRTGTTAVIGTPRLDTVAGPTIAGLAVRGTLGDVTLVTSTSAVVQPSGVTAQGVLFGDFGGDGVHVPGSLAQSSAAGTVVFDPQPAGVAGSGAIGTPTIAAGTVQETVLVQQGVVGNSAVGQPVLVRRDGSRSTRLLLRARILGAD